MHDAAAGATELANAMRAFLGGHLARLQRAPSEAEALATTRALLAGLDDDLRDGLDAADLRAGIRAGPPDGIPGEAEAAAFLAGDPAVRAAWASRAARAARNQALLALAGLEHALASKGPLAVRRAAGSERRFARAAAALLAAIDAWESAICESTGTIAPTPAPAVPGELLLRAREAVADGDAPRAARLLVASLDAAGPKAPSRAAPLRAALAAGDPDVVALALLDGVETVLREARP